MRTIGLTVNGQLNAPFNPSQADWRDMDRMQISESREEEQWPI